MKNNKSLTAALLLYIAITSTGTMVAFAQKQTKQERVESLSTEYNQTTTKIAELEQHRLRLEGAISILKLQIEEESTTSTEETTSTKTRN